MGYLGRFSISELAGQYAFGYFVETGTGHGASLDYAARWNFRALHSCDVDPVLLDQAKLRYADNQRVFLEQESSTVFLQHVLQRLPQSTPILFWLDAHFPGIWSGAAPDAEPDAVLRLPLEEELQLIANTRLFGRDIIVIDDLRIYEEGPFTSGALPDDLRPWCPTERNIDFIYRIMGPTHDIARFYEHEGYILLTPKVYPHAN
jgi:hypothetical protein